MRDSCLIIFIKDPEPGSVKSRLAGDYDDLFAAELYGNFVLDILAGVGKGDWQLRVYFDPPEKENRIRERFGEDRQYRPQCGMDLGEKMKNAFDDCFAEGFQSAVLIGSDFPDLPQKIIEDAFMMLANAGDAVIGPAADGGYYLIGLKPSTFLPDVFSGISWSTESVYSETLQVLRAQGLRVEILSGWHDVDNGEDLIRLVERNRSTPFARSRTMAYLMASGKFTIR